MKVFSRGFATFLAATVVISGVSFLPVYAIEKEEEPSVTQDMVQMEDGSDSDVSVETSTDTGTGTGAGSSADTGSGISAGSNSDSGSGISSDTSGEMTQLAVSNSYAIRTTRDGDKTTREIISLNEMELSEVENHGYYINSMQDLVAALGASNVSVISDTEIKIVKDIVFPELWKVAIAFYTGTYVIDFDGHMCSGILSISLFSGSNVTLLDSSGTNTGGLTSYPIMSGNDVAYSLIPLSCAGGKLTVKSGKFHGFDTAVFAYEGELRIEGGVFEANNDDTWISTTAVQIFSNVQKAEIVGGQFFGGLSAVYCVREIFSQPETSVRNPLQISGGSFSCAPNVYYYGAITYSDNMADRFPNMGELLAKDCYILPGQLNKFSSGAGGTAYVYTAKSVEVKKITGVEGFVHRLYTNVLGRDPDSTGYSSWVTKLKNKEISGSSAAYGFFFSPEMINRDLSDRSFVTLLYNVFFDRSPDDVGMKSWLSTLEMGASRKYIFAGFANSQEWKTLCGTFGIEPGTYSSDEARDQNLKVTAFVNRLYLLCLNRKPERDGLNHWTEVLNNKSQDGAHVAYGFFFSVEFKNMSLSNEDYVEVLYEVLLGRDSDPAGKADWVAQLKAGEDRLEIFRGFVHSQEFDAICAEYGIVRGTI